MPLYEYQCTACAHRFERIVKFSDAPLTTCPQCGKETAKQMISAPAVQFKGSGWYVTDYARKSSGQASSSPAKSEGGAEAASAGKESSGGKTDSGAPSSSSSTEKTSGSSSSSPGGESGASSKNSSPKSSSGDSK